VTINPTRAIHSIQRGCLSVENTNESLLEASLKIARLSEQRVDPRSALIFHNHSETRNCRYGPLLLKADHGSREIFWLRPAQRETRWIFFCLRGSHASLTEQSERGGAVDPGVLRLRRASQGAHVQGVRGARAARAVDSGAWWGEIKPVSVPQPLGRHDRSLRGSCCLNDRAWMAGAAIGTVWRGVAARPPFLSDRGARTGAAWGGGGASQRASVREGCAGVSVRSGRLDTPFGRRHGPPADCNRRRHPRFAASDSCPPTTPVSTSDVTPPPTRQPRAPLAPLGSLPSSSVPDLSGHARCSHRSSPLPPPPHFPRRTRRPFRAFPFRPRTPRGPVVCGPSLCMEVEEEKVSATAALLADDDGADIAAVVQAHFNELMAVRRRARAKHIARLKHNPVATVPGRAATHRGPLKERAPYRITRSRKRGRQRYKTTGTVYLLATTVPPTVVILRPKAGGNRSGGPIPLTGLGPANDQPIQLSTIRGKSPNAISRDEGDRGCRGAPDVAAPGEAARWRARAP